MKHESYFCLSPNKVKVTVKQKHINHKETYQQKTWAGFSFVGVMIGSLKGGCGLASTTELQTAVHLQPTPPSSAREDEGAMNKLDLKPHKVNQDLKSKHTPTAKILLC